MFAMWQSSVLGMVVLAATVIPVEHSWMSDTQPAPTIVVVQAITGIATNQPLSTQTAADGTLRPFAANSPFNVPIAARPAIDVNSAAMVARASRTGMVYANLFQFGIPIFSADFATPRQTVSCTMSWDWGACPLAASPRHIPAVAKANEGSDGVMTVVDSTRNTVDEYWQAHKSGNGWTTSWGAVNSLTGSGWGGSSTGSGASRLAGVVRVAEIQAGVINHALVFQSDNVCAAVVRAPAIKTDGDSSRSDCVPEGARLQLDPGIDVASIAGITAGERTVARALQLYGGYVIDRANSSFGVSFELAPDASWTSTGAVYTRAGFSWDYFGMPHVPWKKLRVLATWNG